MRFSEREALRRLIDFYRRLHGQPECHHPAFQRTRGLGSDIELCQRCGRGILPGYGVLPDGPVLRGVKP